MAFPPHTYYAVVPMARCGGCSGDVPLYRNDAEGWRFSPHPAMGGGRLCKHSDQVATELTEQARHCRCCIEGAAHTAPCSPPPLEPQTFFTLEGWERSDLKG